MTTLTIRELELIAKFDVVPEEVVRPIQKPTLTEKELVNVEFADVASNLNTYTEGTDNRLREMFTTAYEWRNEDPTLIKEVLTSYSPIRVTTNLKKDIDRMVNIAVAV